MQRPPKGLLPASFLLSVFAAIICVGCSSIRGSLQPPSEPVAANQFRAAAARAEITPPPGFPMGGHSTAGQIARGAWTRLYARAVYLEATDGRALALVAADLWSIPAGLADRVAELVGKEESCRHLGRGQIVLAATHTHQSPGNFSSCELYNLFASPEAGFDRTLFEFLAQRITQAITSAVQQRQAARVWFNEATIESLARNRSFPAFLRNPEAEQILADNASLPLGARLLEYPAVEAYRAVDPTVKVLRIESASTPSRVLALAAFFSVHATAMSHHTEFYTSDLFGVATTLAEQQLGGTNWSTEASPVVALFNGAEGDLSPAWQQQNRLETLRLGRRLAEGIARASDGGRRVDGAIAHRFTNAPLAEVSVPGSPEVTTARQPLPGASLLGGAEDGRTVYHERGYVEGLTGRPSADHGVKLPALNAHFLGLQVPATRLVFSRAWVPRFVPVGLYEIGGPDGVVLATLPGEFTLVQGRRIAETVRTNLAGGPAARVVLVGLANEYVSYFTTFEEYQAQHYEGASTLYGPHSGAVIEHHLAEVARHFASNPVPEETRSFEYRTGPTKHFGVGSLACDREAIDGAVMEVVGDARSHSFSWTDAQPPWPPPSNQVTRLFPPARIETLRGGNEWVPARIGVVDETNDGLNFLTLIEAHRRSEVTWRAVWMPPAAADPNARYRFRVERFDGQSSYSDPFSL